MRVKILLMCFVVVALTGCEEDSYYLFNESDFMRGTSGGTTPHSSGSPDGRWVSSGCIRDQGDIGTRSKYDIDGAEWEFSQLFYSRVGCLMPEMVVVTDSIVMPTGEATMEDGRVVKQTEKDVVRQRLAILDNDTLDAWNEDKACGNIELELGMLVDVESCNYGDSIVGKHFYDIYRVEGLQLRLSHRDNGGWARGGKTAKARPTSLDMRSSYHWKGQ